MAHNSIPVSNGRDAYLREDNMNLHRVPVERLEHDTKNHYWAVVYDPKDRRSGGILKRYYAVPVAPTGTARYPEGRVIKCLMTLRGMKQITMPAEFSRQLVTFAKLEGWL